MLSGQKKLIGILPLVAISLSSCAANPCVNLNSYQGLPEALTADPVPELPAMRSLMRSHSASTRQIALKPSSSTTPKRKTVADYLEGLVGK